MAFKVKSIRIQRFKNLEDVQLELGDVNVLVGANNAGKSAVLQAIQFTVSAAQCVDSRRLTPRANYHTATVAPTDLYYSPVDEVMSLSIGKPLTQNIDDGIRLDCELAAEDEEDHHFYVIVAKGKNGNLAVRTDGKQLWDDLSSLDRPFSMYVPGLAGIASHEAYVTPAAVRKAAARGHGNAVLRNVLWQLNHDATRWTRFCEQLASVFPGYSVDLQHEPQTDELVHAFVTFSGHRLPLGLAGAGLLQVVQIMAYMNLYAPALLLLDEPDSHIHPDKQRLLLAVVQDWAADNGTRVLIATHSRHLLDTMEGVAAFHWMQAGKKRDEQDYDRLKVLMELGALDRSDRLRAGDVDAVVLTEDAAAADTHPKKNRSALRTLLRASGLDLGRVQVWSYDGCTNLQTARVLANFIRDNAPGARILVHLDRDYEPDEAMDTLKADLAAADMAVFITDGVDAESHLLSIDHVLELHADADLDRNALATAIDDATQETREQSLARFTSAEDKRLKYAKEKPSSLQVTRDCEFKLDASPNRYRYGKKVLGRFCGKVQGTLGKNPDIYTATQHVAVPELSAFAATLTQPTANNADAAEGDVHA